MIQKKLLLLSVIFCGLTFCFIACDNGENNDDIIPLEFTGLTSDKDSLDIGETAIITATATGKEIRFLWQTSAGTIVGSGYQITYTPTPCVVGENDIECTVRDYYGNTQTKTYTVFINEP